MRLRALGIFAGFAKPDETRKTGKYLNGKPCRVPSVRGHPDVVLNTHQCLELGIQPWIIGPERFWREVFADYGIEDEARYKDNHSTLGSKVVEACGIADAHYRDGWMGVGFNDTVYELDALRRFDDEIDRHHSTKQYVSVAVPVRCMHEAGLNNSKGYWFKDHDSDEYRAMFPQIHAFRAQAIDHGLVKRIADDLYPHRGDKLVGTQCGPQGWRLARAALDRRTSWELLKRLPSLTWVLAAGRPSWIPTPPPEHLEKCLTLAHKDFDTSVARVSRLDEPSLAFDADNGLEEKMHYRFLSRPERTLSPEVRRLLAHDRERYLPPRSG